MKTVKSADGTSIAVEQSGGGPALVLVHGALTDRRCWHDVAPILRRRFTLYCLDRRGRGGSGDATPYSPLREVEDVEAVVRSLDCPVHLLGHSSGAVCSLIAAARLGNSVSHLVLYEPPVRRGWMKHDVDLAARLLDLLETGNGEAAVQTFMREGPCLTEEEISRFRLSGAWPAILAMAHTVAYDAQMVAGRDLFDLSLSRVHVHTTVLAGTSSSPEMRDAAEWVAGSLTHGELISLTGQGHNAFRSDPVLFAATLERVLLGSM